jgi:hypothetical protein
LMPTSLKRSTGATTTCSVPSSALLYLKSISVPLRLFSRWGQKV